MFIFVLVEEKYFALFSSARVSAVGRRGSGDRLPTLLARKQLQRGINSDRSSVESSYDYEDELVVCVPSFISIL